jgi:Zn-dependent protease with chaperone function
MTPREKLEDAGEKIWKGSVMLLFVALFLSLVAPWLTSKLDVGQALISNALSLMVAGVFGIVVSLISLFIRETR